MICKNCNEQLIAKGKYCHSCGQSSHTHRLTVKHFITHDLIHGVFHLDSGLLRTLKEIFTRPGGVALDYINGKRKRYYNFFYLLLLIIGAYLFLKSFETVALNEQPSMIQLYDHEMELQAFIRKYIKLVIFSWIPIFAVAAVIIFRRLRFSLLEFCIPAAIAVIGASIINIFIIGTNLYEANFLLHTTVKNLLSFLQSLLTLCIFLFPMLTFVQLIRGHYSVMGKMWRLMMIYFIGLILVIFSVVMLSLIIKLM